MREAGYSQCERWLRQVSVGETDGDKKNDQMVGEEFLAVTSA